MKNFWGMIEEILRIKAIGPVELKAYPDEQLKKKLECPPSQV